MLKSLKLSMSAILVESNFDNENNCLGLRKETVEKKEYPNDLA